MVDFVASQALAQRLIGQSGGTFTFRAFNTTAADPAKPWEGAADPRVASVTSSQKGLLVEPEFGLRMGIAVTIADLLKRADKVLLVAGTSTDLTQFNEVEFSEGVFKIGRLHRLQPDGVTTVLWFVELKR